MAIAEIMVPKPAHVQTMLGAYCKAGLVDFMLIRLAIAASALLLHN